MRILVSVREFYPFSIGGAEISLITLLRRLSLEHEIHVICKGENNSEELHDAITIRTQKTLRNIRGFFYVIYLLNLLKWRMLTKKQIERVKPDLIITQLSYASAAVSAGKAKGIPSILFLRDFVNICPLNFLGKDPQSCNGSCEKCHTLLHHKLLSPFIYKIRRMHKQAIAQCDVVIANSHCLAKVCETAYGVKAVVVYPFIKLEEYIHEKSVGGKDKITFINPEEHKGIYIVLKIAAALPQYQFQIVGDIKEKMLRDRVFAEAKSYNNITFINTQKDMKSIYATTKILIVPSLWNEPFGRVCVEAMANGIPCIVSNRGGLPEAVGDCGVVINNPLDSKIWVNAIRQLTEDESLYNELSCKCMERIKLFDVDVTFRNLCALIKNELKIAI